jgi:AhpD family alkylhydroperoxidase
MGFYASVGRSLDRKLYEAVYLRLSLINGCHYCTQHHIQGAKRVGLTAEQMTALKEGNYLGFDGVEQAALRYAEKLTRTPDAASDADFAELKRHFSDEQIVDLHMLIGLANLTNRVTGPLALEVEFAEEKI